MVTDAMQKKLNVQQVIPRLILQKILKVVFKKIYVFLQLPKLEEKVLRCMQKITRLKDMLTNETIPIIIITKRVKKSDLALLDCDR